MIYGVRLDIVSVDCEKESDVSVATVRRNRKTAGLVQIYFAIYLCNSHISVVAFVIVGCLWHRCHGVWFGLGEIC